MRNKWVFQERRISLSDSYSKPVAATIAHQLSTLQLSPDPENIDTLFNPLNYPPTPADVPPHLRDALRTVVHEQAYGVVHYPDVRQVEQIVLESMLKITLGPATPRIVRSVQPDDRVSLSLALPNDYTQHVSGTGWFLLAIALFAPNAQKLANIWDLACLALFDMSTAHNRSLSRIERYFFARSLAAVRATKRPLWQALAEQLNLSLPHMTYDDIQLRCLPRLRALAHNDEQLFSTSLGAQRLDQALVAVKHADAFYRQAKLNRAQVAQAIIEEIHAEPSVLNHSALVIANPRWQIDDLARVVHRISQAYERPALLCTPTSGILATVTEHNLSEAVTQIQHLLHQHKQPSADRIILYFDEDNLNFIRRQLSQAFDAQAMPEAINEISIDAELTFAQVTLEAAQQLEKLGPFTDDDRPTFVTRRCRRIRSAKAGRDNQHRRLTIQDEAGFEAQIMVWDATETNLPTGLFDLAYRIGVRYHNDTWQTQLTLVDWQQIEAPTHQTVAPKLFDHRDNIDLAALKTAEQDLQIWAEGFSARESPGVSLSGLISAEALIVYTAPPSLERLKKALDKVTPHRIYIHGAVPAFDTSAHVLQAIVALCQTAQAQLNGEVTRTQLSERLALPTEVIQLALTALQTENILAIDWLNSARFKVIGAKPPGDLHTPALDEALAEIAAYRRYFHKAPLDKLLPV